MNQRYILALKILKYYQYVLMICYEITAQSLRYNHETFHGMAVLELPDPRCMSFYHVSGSKGK